MAHSARTVPVRSSYRAVRWTAFVPSVALVDGAARAHGHERLAGVAPRQRGEQVVGGDRLGRPGVAGGEDAPAHRGQVGREEHLGPGDLLDLGRVPVVEEAVGREVLVDRGEERRVLEPAPGPGHPGRGVDDDAGRLDQALLHERGQGQRGRRHVAAGGGDQPRPLEVGPVELGQPVHRVGQQLGLVVREAVPPRVQGGVLQPEGGREVDQAADLAVEAGRERHARPRGAGRGRRGRGRRPGRRRSARRPGPGRPRPGWGRARPPLHRPGCRRSRTRAPGPGAGRSAAAARRPCSPTPRRSRR